jgi:hypothetical protein
VNNCELQDFVEDSSVNYRGALVAEITGTLLLDHVFVKNLANADAIRAERVFDETVSIESLVPASELAPEDSPLLTHPSDHFGIELDVRL